MDHAPPVTPLDPIATARALVAPGKGILAADESSPTMARRLATIGVDSTAGTRRAYREILLTTPALSDHISGVILFDETIRDRAGDGRRFTEIVTEGGLIPGIKVDAGTVPLAGFAGEVVTEGLDGLRGRLAEYAGLGARFAKWRAVLRIGHEQPSRACRETHAVDLARFAALAQEAGLTPIVEPEVLMDGTHTIERCIRVSTEVLSTVFEQLARHRVDLEGTLLKASMVLPGSQCPEQVDDKTIARATLAVLRSAVPGAVPGIVLLSGGQSDEQATARLNALNRGEPQPWELSFSFGRALQGPVLRAWSGDEHNREHAWDALRHRAALNGAARSGTYRADMEREVVSAPR